MSYTTCRGSPDQQSLAMVRRRGVRGAGTARTSQWKAHLSFPNDRRSVCSTSFKLGSAGAVPEGNEQWKGWKTRNGQCQSWYRAIVMARTLWARTRTERQDEEPQQPTMRVRGRVMPTIIQGPLEVAAWEPSKKPAPLESHRNCCWMHTAIPKY